MYIDPVNNIFPLSLDKNNKVPISNIKTPIAQGFILSTKAVKITTGKVGNCMFVIALPVNPFMLLPNKNPKNARTIPITYSDLFIMYNRSFQLKLQIAELQSFFPNKKNPM